MSTPRYVIEKSGNWRDTALRAGLIGLLAMLCLGGGYYAGKKEIKFRLVESGAEHSARIEQTQQNRAQLIDRVIELERSEQVMRQVNEKLRGRLLERQQEIAGLRTELAFFERLSASGGQQRGLTVHELQIAPTASPQVFDLRLALVQNLQKANRLTGSVAISVSGLLDNRPRELSWDELVESKTAPAFEFKYFQELHIRVMFPDGFLPDSVEVTVRPDSGESFVQQFAWNDALLATGGARPATSTRR